jgi:GT2 family glycosyltransferase
MIHVCVPVLKRYDLLRELLVSLSRSDLPVDMIHVVDNGRNSVSIKAAFEGLSLRSDVYTPLRPMGVAETWNWFIKNTTAERLITNDDVTFAPRSLGEIWASPAPFVSCTFGFSCFLIRDSCVDRVGMFDESISPGYAYFEDMDYLRRMRLAGVIDAVVECGVKHVQGATLAAYSPEELDDHHRKFQLAQANYTAKWRGKPSMVQLDQISSGARRP